MTLVHHARSPADSLKEVAGRKRVVIERVRPEVDCGRFPIKRVVGETVMVEADVFADGHDQVAAALLYCWEGESDWAEVRMQPLVNDRWRAEFPCSSLGRYLYTIEAWPDPAATWRADLLKRIEAGQDVGVDLLIGAALIEDAASRARGEIAERLWNWAALLRHEPDQERRRSAALRED